MTNWVRRATFTVILVLLGAWLAGAPAVAAAPAAVATGEAIERFDAVYVLDASGNMDVTETIRWRFPQGAERHGIKRNIIVRMGYNDSTTQYRYFPMTQVRASSPTGANADVSVTEFGAANVIRIGSPNETVTGTQTYVLKYRLGGVMNPLTDQSSTVELYYNVFSASEQTLRENVSVTVTGPAGSTRAQCYRGETKSTQLCSATAGKSTLFTATQLGAGDAMTILGEFPKAAYPDVSVDVRDYGNDTSGSDTSSGAVASESNAMALVGGVTAPLLAVGLMGALIVKRGRDERYAGLAPGMTPAPGESARIVRGRGPEPAVQFSPPKGVQPGLVGTVIDEVANPIDVSATVIDLAVRGYLQIEEVQTGSFLKRSDWKLTRLVPRTNDLLPYESVLLEGIFARDNPVLLSELRNHFASTLSSVQSEMYAEVTRRGWFRKSPQATRTAWSGLGIALLIVGGIAAFAAGNGARGLTRALSAGSVPSGWILGGGIALAGVVVMIMGSKMAAKTAEGSAVNAQSMGFKQYLVTAEAGQIAFEEASNIFSRYLPYAVVFGVAQRWAKTFAQVAAAAEAAGQPLVMPTWYIYDGFGMPDFTSITDGVDSFSTTAGGTFTSTPGSSGTTSGFGGGGGFSGGGGGGSSSGSW